MLLSEWRNKFFVFHKDSSWDYSYNPLDIRENGQRVRVDSKLKLIRGSNNFDTILSKKPDTSSWIQGHSILRKVYNFPKTDSTPSGRVIFSYSKGLNKIKESLNAFADSARRMKLFKIQFAIDEFYDKKTKTQWPSMEIAGDEMKEVHIENPHEIMIYFKQYEKDISSN